MGKASRKKAVRKQTPRTVLFNNAFEGDCPFCGGKFTAGYADGDAETGIPSTTHSMPMCPKYEKLGLVEYLSAVREQEEKVAEFVFRAGKLQN